MSSYFPMTGFKATVCASTGDNRHNCSNPIWGGSNRKVGGKAPLMSMTIVKDPFHTVYIDLVGEVQTAIIGF